jgi:GNAT superfamily N-acetyltransferase
MSTSRALTRSSGTRAHAAGPAAGPIAGPAADGGGGGERAPDIVIRPMRRRDIPGFVALRRDLWVDLVITAESFAWTLAHEPAADQARRWVATRQGRVVGIAEAIRAPWSPAGVSLCHIGVDAALRGLGIGRRLFAEAERHVARLGADQTRARIASGDEPSARFARRCGFHHARDHRTWSLDPRSVSVADLPRRLAAAEAAGLRLVAIRDLMDRPRDLFRLNVALLADVPADVPGTWAYDDWRAVVFDTPLFSPDASFCVLAGEEPVAVSWIMVDAVGGRAEHAVTGTLPAFRHRGLAPLVKLAAVDWLARHDVAVLLTENDTENGEMLAINEHLGYQPLVGFEIWARER